MSELHSIPAPCAAGLKAETEAALLRTYIAGYGGPLDHFDARLDRTIGMARLMFEATDNADHFDFELSTSGIKCGFCLLPARAGGHQRPVGDPANGSSRWDQVSAKRFIA